MAGAKRKLTFTPRKTPAKTTRSVARYVPRGMVIKGFVGEELKFRNKQRLFVAVPVTGATMSIDDTTDNCLASATQGDGMSQRIGSRIQIQDIRVNVLIRYIGPTLRPIRLFIVVDSTPNKVDPLVTTDFWTDFDAVAGHNSLGDYNLSAGKRFKVLKDLVINPPSAALTATEIIEKHIVVYHKFKKPLRQQYVVGNAGMTLASQTENALHIFAIGPNTIAGAEQIAWQSRMRFYG